MFGKRGSNNSGTLYYSNPLVKKEEECQKTDLENSERKKEIEDSFPVWKKIKKRSSYPGFC